MASPLAQKTSPENQTSPESNVTESETIYAPADDLTITVPAGSTPEAKSAAVDSALAGRFPHNAPPSLSGVTMETPENGVSPEKTPPQMPQDERSQASAGEGMAQKPAADPFATFLSGTNALIRPGDPFSKGFVASLLKESDVISEAALIQGGHLLQEMGNESFVEKMEKFRRDPGSILRIAASGGLNAFFGMEALKEAGRLVGRHTDIDFEMQKAGYAIQESLGELMDKAKLNREDQSGMGNEFLYDLGAGVESLAMSMGIANLVGPHAAGIWFGLKQDAQIYQEATRTMVVKDRASGKVRSMEAKEFTKLFEQGITENGVGFKDGDISKNGVWEIVRAPVNTKDARAIAALAGIAEGALEYWGMERMINRIKGFFLKRVVATGLNEAVFNEMPQQLSEELIARGFLKRPGDVLDITKRVLYAGAMGFILGMGGGGFQAALDMQGRKGELLEQGMSPEEAESQIKFEHWVAQEVFVKRGIQIATAEEINAMLQEDAAEVQADKAKFQMKQFPEWFSAAEKLIMDKMPGRAPVQQVKNLLVAMKKDEREATKIEEFLKDRDPQDMITKQEVLNHLIENRTKVVMETRGQVLRRDLRSTDYEAIGDLLGVTRDEITEIMNDPEDPDNANMIRMVREELGIDLRDAAIVEQLRREQERVAEKMDTMLAMENQDAQAWKEKFDKLRERFDRISNELQDTLASKGGKATKYGGYLKPWKVGSSYKEQMIILDRQIDERFKKTLTDEEKELIALNKKSWSGTLTTEDVARHTELSAKYQDSVSSKLHKIRGETIADFTGGHWGSDTKNVLANVLQRDVEINGKKYLHMIELQSDWHTNALRRRRDVIDQLMQSGKYTLKEAMKMVPEDAGYTKVTPAEKRAAEEKWREVQKDLKALLKAVDNLGFDSPGQAAGAVVTEDDYLTRYDWGEFKDAAEKIVTAYHEAQSEFNLATARDVVPDAPFKRTWHEMAIKKMIRHAIEQGYAGIMMDVGETVAGRYNLSIVADEISWVGAEDGGSTVTIVTVRGDDIELYVNGKGEVETSGAGPATWIGKDIGEIVGDDIAEKIMTAETPGKVSGDELRVGDKGKKSLYDEKFKGALEAIVKRLGGGKVETEQLTAESEQRSVYEGPLPETATELEIVEEDLAEEGPGIQQQYERVKVDLENYVKGAVSGDYVRSRMGRLISPYLAKIMGGDIVDRGKPIVVPVYRVDFNDAMRENVMKGQPLFQAKEGATPEQTAEDYAAFNRAIRQWYELRHLIPPDFQLILGDLAGKDFNAFTLLMNRIVAVMKDAGDTAVPHEAFHIIFSEVLSPELRAELIKEAVANHGDAIRAIMESQGLTQDQAAEEWLSERFAEAWNNRPAPKGFLGRVADFIRDLVGFLKGVRANYSVIEQTFNDIVNGKYDQVEQAAGQVARSLFGIGAEYLDPEDLAQLQDMTVEEVRDMLRDRLYEVAPEAVPVFQRKFTDDQKNAIEKNAVNIFGTTKNFKEAGYMLRDGTMLDFSGRHSATGYEGGSPMPGKPDYLANQRSVDHREIYKAFMDLESDDATGTQEMIDFVGMGNIRMQESGIEISKRLTPEQKRIIQKHIMANAGESFDVDIQGEDGEVARAFAYNWPEVKPAGIIKAIDRYFDRAEKRAKFQAKDQGDLFAGLDDKIKAQIAAAKPEVQVADGGKKARAKRVQGIINSEKDIYAETHTGRGPLWQSHFALKFRQIGSLMVPGQRVVDAADLAFAFQELKNETQEHFLVGAVKKGRIVGVELIHIGTLDEAGVWPWEQISVLDHYDADSFFCVHHHPSGKIEPSREDYEITAKIKANMGNMGFTFLGHVIINDTKFGFIDADMTVTQQIHKEFSEVKKIPVLKKYVEWKTQKDKRPYIRSPQAMFDLGKGIQISDSDTLVVFLDKSLMIQNAMIMPTSIVNTKNIGRLSAFSRSKSIAIINGKDINDREWLEQVYKLKEGMVGLGVRILDVVGQVKAAGFPTESYTSFSERNMLDPGNPYEVAKFQRKTKKQIAGEMKQVKTEIGDLVNAEVEFLQGAWGDIVGGQLQRRYLPGSESSTQEYTFFRQSLPKEIKHPLTGNKPVNPTQWRATALRNLENGYSQFTEEYETIKGAEDILKRQLAELEAQEAQEILEFRERMKPDEERALKIELRDEADRHFKQMEIFDDDSDIIIRDVPNYLLGIDAADLKDIHGYEKNFKDVYRIFKKVFGPNFKQIEESVLDALDQSVTQYYKLQKKLTDELYKEIVQKLGIKKGSDESAAVMLWGEHKIEDENELVKKFGREMTDKIILADKWFRSKYNELIEAVNQVRQEIYPNSPEKLVPFRRDYYRHFQEITGLKGLINLFDTPAQISPALVGMSEFLKPRSKWASYMQRRKGDFTTYDAVGSFLDYIPAASYSIFVDPNIVVFRALAKELRNMVGESTHLNNFIQFLEEYANDLAGKTGGLDRLMPYLLGEKAGRKTMQILNYINGRAKSNVILGNVASVIAQAFNIPQAVGAFKLYAFPAIVDTAFGNKEQEKSQFLNNRYADSMYDKFDTSIFLVRAPKIFFKKMLVFMDEVATRYIWNGFHRQAVARREADPIAYADKMTRAQVAGRAVGEVPLIQKQKIFQLLLPFQLEVTNLWWALGDRVRDKDFMGLLIFALVMRMMNFAAEKVRGSRVALDPILAILEAFPEVGNLFGMEIPKKTVAQRIGRIAGEVLSNAPGGSWAMSLYPEYGAKGGLTRKQFFGSEATRFTNSPLPTVKALWSIVRVLGMPFGVAGSIPDALADLTTSVIMPYGGLQAKKTMKGMAALESGKVYFGKNKKPVRFSRTMANTLRAALFGPYSIKEVSDYFDMLNQRLETVKEDEEE